VERRCLALERELHEAQRRAEVRFPVELLPPLPPPIGAVAPNGSSPEWLKPRMARTKRTQERGAEVHEAAVRRDEVQRAACVERGAGLGTLQRFCMWGHR